MKKKMILLVALLILVAAMTGCGKKQKIKVYLPGAYHSDEAIRNFEKEFDCKVIIEEFDSNESMYTKILTGGKYDVLIPSDYTIERLIREGYLQKLDSSAMTNLGELTDEVKNLDFDPNNEYSVPYFWGTVGIVYNKNNVDFADLEEQGFGIFANPKYDGRTFMYDSARDGFMIALKTLGYSCNTEDEAQINEAYEWLLAMNKATHPIYVTDEVIDRMKANGKDLAIVYSGDAADILSENENMGYYTPMSGTNLWFDAMVIPKNAENPELANKFINYMLSYEPALLGSQEIGYASPNKKVLDEMASTDYADNEAYLPRKYEKDEIFHDNETLRNKLNELWIMVMGNGK